MNSNVSSMRSGEWFPDQHQEVYLVDVLCQLPVASTERLAKRVYLARDLKWTASPLVVPVSS